MKLIYIVLSVLFLTSCSDYSIEEYQRWMSDKNNGLIQEVENDFFKIEVQYKPQEYIVAKEYAKKKLTSEEYDSTINSKNELQYFTIKLISKTGESFLKTNLEDPKEEELRLQYYIGGFERDIYLADGKDTLPCVLYHFEKSFGGVPFNNVSVAFENKNNNNNDKTLLMAERVLGFDVETFKFKKEAINNIPKIKYN